MDLQSGVVLCHLIGGLTKQKIRGITTNPKSPAHRMANLSLALGTAEDNGVKVTVSPQVRVVCVCVLRVYCVL